ncbi:MAG: protein-disulfide reductase DsbD N-terminal domain-containing protein [Gammaproteobacteria bacterium]|jgi:thiol:disulfide interchange protein DsbD|nr:protein-disulfide reductase DsbD N-terminal domain-containing protein [Gammaproteobacteria bacterium]
MRTIPRRARHAAPVFLVALLFAAPAAADGMLSDLGRKLFGQQQPKFLPPDQAFAMSAEVVDAATVRIGWRIAEGYYLYRDRLSFRLGAGEPGTLGVPVLPEPSAFREDEFFGRMAVYYDQVAVVLPVERGADAGTLPIRIEASWQGCAAAGFCYPPMNATVELTPPSN